MTGMMMSLLLIFASKRAMGFPWWPRRLLLEKVTFSRLVAGSRLRAAVRTFSSLSVAWANRLISTDAMGGALGNFECALLFWFLLLLLLCCLLKSLDVFFQFCFSSLVDWQMEFQRLGKIQLDFLKLASAEASSSSGLAAVSLNQCLYAHVGQPEFSDCES